MEAVRFPSRCCLCIRERRRRSVRLFTACGGNGDDCGYDHDDDDDDGGGSGGCANGAQRFETLLLKQRLSHFSGICNNQDINLCRSPELRTAFYIYTYDISINRFIRYIGAFIHTYIYIYMINNYIYIYREREISLLFYN